MEEKKLPKLKIGLLGDLNAGKTSLIHRFISGTFEENLMPTVGMEGQSKDVTVQNRPFSALIFDTAGTKIVACNIYAQGRKSMAR